jgi:UTP--glucose-1-phosphate uridylyltransferase
MNPINHFSHFENRMREAGLPPVAIRTFGYYYEQLVAGETGLIPENSIEPVRDLPDAEALGDSHRATGQAALGKVVVIKLNGGLGTSMGMQKAKTLLQVKSELRFIDIIVRQTLHAGVPLVLMNSFATRRDSLEALNEYPALAESSIPLDFLQHKFPKVLQADLSPAESPQDPELAWNPPGHGDLYTALVTSGMLDTLLEAGLEYAFVSNGDNLGAVLDPDILGFIAAREIPFLMEVADRTRADRKGGHLAQRKSGGLVLRESAQCPPGAEDAFQDIQKYSYFNTNNLWIHLPTLQDLLHSRHEVMGLPLIRNAKTLDPRDPHSPPVYQLESAMGAAIELFDNAQALRVPRSRFSPVKTTDDLLAVRSDAFRLTKDYRVVLDAHHRPVVDLDKRYYRLIDELDHRFPHGAPSLRECLALEVSGDVHFGQDVIIRGKVVIRNPDEVAMHIADHTILEG